MLVIEGYAGKSLEVEKYIETLVNQDVLIFTNDKQVFNYLVSESNNVYITEQFDAKDVEKVLGLNDRFSHVIFYLNVKKEDVDIYKKLEHAYDLKAVLTVQTHDRENPREISKYFV